MDAAQYIERNRDAIVEDWRRLIRDRAGPEFVASIASGTGAAEFDQVLSRLVAALRTNSLDAQRREHDMVMGLSAAMANRWIDGGVDFEDAYRGIAAVRWAVWNAVQRGVFDLGLLTLRDLVTVGRLLNRFVDTMLMQAGVLYVGSTDAATAKVAGGAAADDLAAVEDRLHDALAALKRLRHRLEAS